MKKRNQLKIWGSAEISQSGREKKWKFNLMEKDNFMQLSLAWLSFLLQTGFAPSLSLLGSTASSACLPMKASNMSSMQQQRWKSHLYPPSARGKALPALALPLLPLTQPIPSFAQLAALPALTLVGEALLSSWEGEDTDMDSEQALKRTV